MPKTKLAVERLEDRLTPVTFGNPTGYAAGSNATAVALGDVDNDGDVDLAVAAASGGAFLKLNNGSGVFTDSANAALVDPRSVELVDMDGDGNRDLVGANGGGFQLVVIRGKGDGTFDNTITKTVPAGGSQDVLTGDFNGDGRRDAIVLSINFVNVFLNTGTAGLFDTFTSLTVNSDTAQGAVGDFDADGDLDLALAGNSTRRVDVLLNNGNGTFAPKVSYDLPGRGGAVAAGDLNGDGRADIAAVIGQGSGLHILLANADGTFASPVGYTPPSGNTDGVALADVDRDGNLDVVTRSFGISRALVWLGAGDGTVGAPALIQTGVNPSDLALADLNGDLLPDIASSLALSPGSAAVALNTTPDNFRPQITSNGGLASASVSVAENATAVTTVTASDAAGQTLTYSISGGADASKFVINSTTGALAFATAPDFEAPTDAGGNNVYNVTVQVSDATLADTQALAVTVTNVAGTVGFTTTTATVTEGNRGTKAVTFTVTRTGDAGPVSVNFATLGGSATAGTDFLSASGTLTWAAGDFTARTVTVQVRGDRIIEGTEALTVRLTSAVGTALGASTATVTIADNDPYQRYNWALGAGTGGTVATYDSNGALTSVFAPLGTLATGGVRVATGDVTGDGVDDLVALSVAGTQLVAVYSGATGGLVGAFVALPPEFGPGTLAVGDVTGDGRADIVVGTTRTATGVAVYSGADFGLVSVFLPFGDVRVGANVATGDTDGDGIDEIVVGAATTASAVGVFTASGVLKNFFLAFGSFPIGATVSAGDLNGDGLAELVVGTASGVAAFGTFTASGALQGLFQTHPAPSSGITTTVADINNDGRAEVIAGNAVGTAIGLVYLPPNTNPVTFLVPFGFPFNGGIYVG